MKIAILISGFLFFAAKIADAQTVTSGNVLATLNTQHPRLLATTEDFERLREEIHVDPNRQAWFNNLLGEALKILEASPSTYEIPDGKRLLATSVRVKDRVYTLAMAYRLTGDQRFPVRAWNELSAAANFKDWNPKHYLDTAEMTHGFAIGYDWLYDVWTPAQRTTIRNAIRNKGLNTALPLYRNKQGFVTMRNNWNPVCNGGIGMGALAIADEAAPLASEILAGALSSIPRALSQYGPDDGWNEGPAYWRYTTIYAATFMASLQSALGTDFGLSDTPGFAETCLFPIYMSGPAGQGSIRQSFNFADSKAGSVGATAMFWLAKRFFLPVCADFQIRNTKGTAVDLLWYDNSFLESTEMLPLDKYYRKVEVATFRSAWDDPNAMFAGLKAGDNRVSHSHLDLGSFVLDALGHRWAEDLGPDNYNLPGYFGNAQRWQYYRLCAEGHNTLVINPGKAADQNPSAVAPIVRFYSEPIFAYAIVDLSMAYGMNVQRGLAMYDRQHVIVQDEISARTPSDVWWFMHTRATIELDNSFAVLTMGDTKLVAEIISPPGATFSVLNAEPLPTSPNPTQANNTHVNKLTIHLHDVTETTLVVIFSNQQINATVPPLDQW